MKKEDEASLRDLGVEPYLYKDYADWASKMFEQLKYRFSPEMESQFKKPYLKFDHVKSEREYAGPGGGGDGTQPFYPPYVPTPYTPPKLPDFTMPGYSPPGFYLPSPSPTMPGPGSGGFGSAGPSTPGPNMPPGPASPHAPNPNEPDVQPHKAPCEKCVTFEFPRYSHIYRVEAVGGTLSNQRKTGDDTMSATVCWLDDAGIVKAIAYYDTFEEWAVVEASAEKHSCGCSCIACNDPSCETLSLGYTSQQMSCSGTQALSATKGAGEYSWTLSGGGSLSDSTGATTTYTAPSSNANCTDNPTITLTDCCSNTATLKIAVNCYSESPTAYFISTLGNANCGTDLTCCWNVWRKGYSCTGVYKNDAYACDGCSCDRPECNCCCCNQCGHPDCDLPTCFHCNSASLLARCNADSKCGSFDSTTVSCNGVTDYRTATLKAGGCCPAALL